MSFRDQLYILNRVGFLFCVNGSRNWRLISRRWNVQAHLLMPLHINRPRKCYPISDECRGRTWRAPPSSPPLHPPQITREEHTQATYPVTCKWTACKTQSKARQISNLCRKWRGWCWWGSRRWKRRRWRRKRCGIGRKGIAGRGSSEEEVIGSRGIGERRARWQMIHTD